MNLNFKKESVFSYSSYEGNSKRIILLGILQEIVGHFFIFWFKTLTLIVVQGCNLSLNLMNFSENYWACVWVHSFSFYSLPGISRQFFFILFSSKIYTTLLLGFGPPFFELWQISTSRISWRPLIRRFAYELGDKSPNLCILSEDLGVIRFS